MLILLFAFISVSISTLLLVEYLRLNLLVFSQYFRLLGWFCENSNHWNSWDLFWEKNKTILKYNNKLWRISLDWIEFIFKEIINNNSKIKTNPMKVWHRLKILWYSFRNTKLSNYLLIIYIQYFSLKTIIIMIL